jgi:hypothetical protein
LCITFSLIPGVDHRTESHTNLNFPILTEALRSRLFIPRRQKFFAPLFSLPFFDNVGPNGERNQTHLGELPPGDQCQGRQSVCYPHFALRSQSLAVTLRL